MSKGILIVLSGPSGVGKGTVNKRVRELLPNLKKSISVTTRPRRPNEIDGVHYHFITQEQFDALVKDDGLLEYAQVYQNFYGTPKKPVLEALEKGDDMIFELDIQGARLIKQTYNDCVRIFISPPSIDELSNRLNQRGTETEEVKALRLSQTKQELEEASFYDYFVVNNNIDKAAKKVVDIISAEKAKTSRNKNKIDKLLKGENII
ncbi:MAG TPA: guanylate kinase [Clostridiales bacterium]|jgi:guanylate kinase|nr:guanylate kinase [Clostridiales bacterium]